MDGACSTYGEEKICIQGFGGETRGRDHLEDPGLDWRNNIKMDLQEVSGGHGLN